MRPDDLLPEGLLWRDDGHVSDLGINALADGEESLLPETIGAHVDSCEDCTERLADAALLAASVQAGVEELGLVDAGPLPVAARFPLLAVMLGVAVALAGAWPSVSGGSSLWPTLTKLFVSLPSLARSISTVGGNVLRHMHAEVAVVAFAGALVMLWGGWRVARAVALDAQKGQLP